LPLLGAPSVQKNRAAFCNTCEYGLSVPYNPIFIRTVNTSGCKSSQFATRKGYCVPAWPTSPI
jgi:hypothetical protein